MARSSLHLKDHWQEQRLFLSRVIAAAIIVLLLTGLLVTRLVQLQIFETERFVELSQGNRFRIEPMPPTRGLIYWVNRKVILLFLVVEIVCHRREIGNTVSQ
jgi:penicillin-binding protein 2